MYFQKDNNNQNHLHIYLGPMFSGKSTNLIDTIINLSQEGLNNSNILIINHAFDIRYGKNEISTHLQKKLPCYSITNIKDIYNLVDLNNITHVFIDEAQFFKDLYPEVKHLLLKLKKTVYLAGLDGDFKQEPFLESNLLSLIPYATTVKKFTANCTVCKHSAQLTKRLIISDEKILVGGSDEYQPVCINHI
jgi:thymidine kinase